MKLGPLKYAIAVLLLPSITFAQLVKKDDTPTPHCFTEDVTVSVAIATHNHMPAFTTSIDEKGSNTTANGKIQDIRHEPGTEERVSIAELSDQEQTELSKIIRK